MPAPTTHKLDYTWALLPTVSRGSSVVLSADADAKTFAYCSGAFVVLRSLDDPAVARVYTGHRQNVGVARFAPSSGLVASGDDSGVVHLWAADQLGGTDVTREREVQCIAGRVRDIAWDFESRRIVAVGDGRSDKFGHAFLVDTGAPAGVISAHTKSLNAVCIRPARPMRAVTVGDDTMVNFFEGPPFKLTHTCRGVHTRFVSSVKFHPKPPSSIVVTAGLDGKIVYFNSDNAQVIGTIDDAHAAGIYAMSISSDGRHILTSSADGYAKVWDFETKQEVTKWDLGAGTIPGQQLGNLWAGDHMLTVGLTGLISYLDMRTGSVSRVIDGHMGAVCALKRIESSGVLVSGSREGRVVAWDENSGIPKALPRDVCHEGSVIDFADAGAGAFVSVGEDSSVRRFTANGYTLESTCKVDDLPSGKLALLPSLGFLMSRANNPKMGPILVEAEAKAQGQMPAALTGAAVVAIKNDGSMAAIVKADRSGNIVLRKGELLQEECGKIETRLAEITLITFSTDGSLLAVAGSTGAIELYNLETLARVNEWSAHSSRVMCLTFSPDSRFAASGGVDGKLVVWSVAKRRGRTEIRGAHHGVVYGVAFDRAANNIIYTSGAEGVRKWSVSAMPS